MNGIPTGRDWVEVGDAGRGNPGAGSGSHGGVKARSGTGEGSNLRVPRRCCLSPSRQKGVI